MHYLTGVIVASVRGTQTTAGDQASFQIQGTLKDSSGNPIANAILSLGISQSIVSREAVTTSTTTDANGNYTLNLKLGNFSVKVTNSSGVEIGSFRMNATSTTTKPEISVTSGNMSLGVTAVTVPSPISPVTPSNPSTSTIVAPSKLSYSPSSLTLTVGTVMTSIIPTITGSVTLYSVSSNLPIGLTLNSSTGTISGTPVSSQSASNYTITASNSMGRTTFTIQITINHVAPSNLSYPSSLLNLSVGSAMNSLTPIVTGIVTSYSVSPSLPTGLVLNPSSGIITGTPVSSQLASIYKITATNNSGDTNSILQIKILPIPIIRNWATFSDMLDGTVKVDVNPGIYGGQTYTAKTLYFSKCSHGQTYNQVTISCTGSASRVQFCSTNDSSCNGGNPNNSVSSGPLYDACNSINSNPNKPGNRIGWRVPTKNELRLLINCNNNSFLPSDNPENNSNYCGINNFSPPTINTIFGYTVSSSYWSSDTFPQTDVRAYGGWFVDFGQGLMGNLDKTVNYYVMCVTSQ